ncbi:DUF3159 domain-containing protein [Neomicrococcus aestuarii]|uniref:Potassium ABC transporter n=1 Tax=Neomicrococcus aestuarii TaxID=556325 RepID=A0A1L2ZKP5_9MICC|nr:DUF3159 domain-containing protein [Neomicrococcus aestuarii]APF39779.1 potassium ABC transporter [Neomicrococcus aestuarii]
MSENTPNEPSQESLARQVAQSAGVHHKEDGQVDVLRTVGGWRGILESLLPGLVFLVVFTATQQLNPSLIASLAVAVIFTIARLVQKTPLTQALAGLIGVVVCAFVARTTGEARDYYVPGFFTNAGYALALIVSIAVKWPLMGVILGFIRGEGTAWRQKPDRKRAYVIATWVLVAMFIARIAVQVPLYFANMIEALGTARLIMGIPLYAGALWLAWLVSRPVDPTATEDEALELGHQD